MDTTSPVVPTEIASTHGVPGTPSDTPAVPLVPTPTTPPKNEPLSARFEALTRKERSIQKRIEQAKSLEVTISAREAKVKEYEAAFEKAQSDPDAALSKVGWNYAKLTDYYLNNKQITPEAKVQQVEERLQSYVTQQEKEKKQATEDAKSAAQAESARVIEEWKTGVNEFVTANQGDYELINLHEAFPLVTELIQAHFEKFKKVLSNKEAAEKIEAYLEERVEASTKTTRLQKKYGARGEENPESPNSDNAAKEARSLSNALSQSGPSLLPAATERERMERALAFLNK